MAVESYADKYTQEALMAEALSLMQGTHDKREGSIDYWAVAAFSNMLSNFYIFLDYERNQLFPNTADREHLLIFAQQQSVPVKAATAVISRGVFNVEAQVAVGDRFNQGDMNFIVIYQITDDNGVPVPGNYALQAETAGSIGNAYSGRLVPIGKSIPGMTSAELTEVLIPGEDEEGTEEIRQQVIDSYNAKSYGFNRIQYITVTEDLPGVGGAKAERRQEGTSMVNVWIIASNYTAPTQELINQVQEALDPVENSGEGIGLVPIGHRVTVIGVENFTVDVSVNVDLVEGWTWEAIEPYIMAQITGYFTDLAKEWSAADQTIVRSALLVSRIVNLEGVLDVHELLLNGSQTNIPLDVNQIPVAGTLTRIE